MDKQEKKFYEVFTDLQCFILANMNRGEVHGVTATHYNIIEYVYRHDKCTSNQIAKAFNISAAAISRQLKFLVEHAYIKQEQAALDRRFFHLSILAKGKFIIDNSEDFREKVAQKAAKTLPKEEFDTLIELLSKVVGELTK